MVYSVWTLYKSTSSRMLGVNSRKSRTERSMSLDCVTYLPTMSMSAPWSSASLAVSGTIPPATAACAGSKNFTRVLHVFNGDFWHD